MVIEEIKKHPVDFSLLAAIFIMAVFAFLQVLYDNRLKRVVIFSTGLLYFLWGIFHHWRKGDLCARIVAEYFLLALLGVVTATFTVIRG